MAGKWQLKDHEAERELFTRRLAVAAVFVFLLFTALILKLVNLQVSQYEYFSARSDGNRLHSQYVPPARGLIFDRNGELLADNQPIFNLTVVREQTNGLDKTLELVSSLIGLSEEDVEQFNARMKRNRVPFSSVPLRYVLNDEEKSIIAVNSHKLPGVAIEPQFVRHYPFNELAAHSVGYVSEINRTELEKLSLEQRESYGGINHIGKTGIERTYEDLLHGTVGYEIVEKNNRGQVMRRLDRTDPIAGKNITLHLDSRLQMVAEKALGDYRGAIVAIDPATGGILAMVSRPGFDPNLFVTGISNKDYSVLVNDEINTPLFDRATNPYPPGSTVKPFIGLGGLQYDFVDYDYTVEDPGFFKIPGVSRRYGDWTYRTAIGGGHGTTDLQRAIYQSCDTFFYDLGYRMGIDNIHAFMSQFGFGDNFAIDIPHARTGVLPSRQWKEAAHGEPWYQGDTVVSAIGNGYMWATPLQLATAVSIMANSGKVVAPRMLKSIEGETELPLADSSIPDVIVNDPDYWRYMQESMTMVVHKPFVSGEFRHNGGAYEYIAMKDRNMAYKMAGKKSTTPVGGFSQGVFGSSEIELQDKHKDHGLFVSYAPAENPYIEPKIALAVFVENGEHGGSVASPIAKEITDAYLLDILQIDFAAISSGTDELVSLADE